jgi:hypothetical protein
MRLIGPAAFALFVAPALAHAQDGSTLYDTCFVRTYDAAHMQAHPDQRVVEMQAFFQEYEDGLWAGIYYTVLPSGTKFALSGDCSGAAEGGFLCHVCANDLCDRTGETFKVIWAGGDTLDIVNDATGVTGQDAGGARDDLEPGGEHGRFQLDRAADPTACDWLTN